jgi:hypothetical protein
MVRSVLLLLFVVVWIALPHTARAQQPQAEAHAEARTRQPVEVASGQDLVAWQSLEHLRLQGTQAVLAYRTFVLDYDASPLAVAAWSRLVELGGALIDHKDERVAKTLAAVRDRWATLQAAVASEPDVVVAEIDMDEPSDDDAAAAVRDTGAN